MLTAGVRRVFAGAALTAGALLGAAADAGAQAGSPPPGAITGQVTDRQTQRPIATAQVFVVGISRSIPVDGDGRYRIFGVRPGPVELRALAIGYAAMTQTITVVSGQPVVADFALTPSVVRLDELIVTATGDEERVRETGNAVGTIAVDSVVLSAVPTFSDLLSSRTAGVTVQPGTGTSGLGSRIRIRGSNSISLQNEPLLIVDGARVNNQSDFPVPIGGQAPSRFNDINPEDIDRIDVLKGPAASALYGTAAANGVIQITTKRGRPGRTRWNLFTEGGRLTEPTDWPANYSTFGKTPLLPPPLNGISLQLPSQICNLDAATIGLCTRDSVVSFNPLEAASPFRNGYRFNSGLNISGGGEAATYFLAGEVEREQGVYDNNLLKRVNLRTNVRSQLRKNLDANVSVGFVGSQLGVPLNDNGLGFLFLGLLGGGRDCSPATPCLGVPSFQTDTITRGYVALFDRPVHDLYRIENRQDIERLTGSLTTNWRPLSWLSGTVTGGLDLTNRHDNLLYPPGLVTALPLFSSGARGTQRTAVNTYTLNGSLTADYGLTPSLRASSSVGGQYINESSHGTGALGRGLTPGTGTLNGTTADFVIDEPFAKIITVGGYLQQQLALKDRLFLTGSIRNDRNSAFGTDFKNVAYPSASLSWVIGEEPFFPGTRVVSSLRLRAAYGQSGQRPGFRSRDRFFTPIAVQIGGVDAQGITIGGAGNPNLKPERSIEREFGLDAGLFNGRVGIEFTVYNKLTKDALIQRPLAGSLGETSADVTDRFENLGRVRNKGVELLVRAGVLQARAVTLDLTGTLTTNRNRVEALGLDAPILFSFSNSQRHQQGFPLGAYFGNPILDFADADGDGIINRAEVTLGPDPVYLGTPFPKTELSLATAFTFFEVLRVSALFDHRGGFQLFNDTRFFRCSVQQNCRDIHDPTAPLRDQANARAALQGSIAGYVEDASFTKLRELSFTLLAPRGWAAALRASAINLTVSGRNLKTWTDYSGSDPEVNTFGTESYLTVDFLTQPPVRYWTTRLTFSY